MFETPEKRRQISRWLIRIFTCYILIYLGLRHINSIAAAVSRLLGLVRPLLIGIILALIFNVPMSFIESRLRPRLRFRKALRPLSIVLSLLLVFGIFVLVALLVVPELTEAIAMIIRIVTGSLDQLDRLETDTAFLDTPLGGYLADTDIDWSAIKLQLETWLQPQGGTIVGQAVGAAGTAIGRIVTFIVALFFSIYGLANKEKLNRQICRLIRVWLPEKFGEGLIHVASVSNRTFQRFVSGQAMEAIILGTLCMLGMVILRIPYAPLIGALVGVTALIPVVGAFVGTVVGAIMILTVNPLKALIFVIFLLILQQVEGNLIYPRVVGSRIRLPAMWVLAAVTVGGNLGGPIGMFLGVPAASAAYALLKEATDIHEKKKYSVEETHTE